MSEYRKQLPAITSLDKPFWEAAKKHELVAYKCLHCGTMYSHPMECIVCDHPEWSGSRSAVKDRYLLLLSTGSPFIRPEKKIFPIM